MSSNDSDGTKQSVNISGEAGDVTVIGKLELRIRQVLDKRVLSRLGLELRLSFILLAALVIAVGFIVWLFVGPKPPVPMSGDVRIAVAGFAERVPAEETEQAPPEEAGLGMDLARNVFQRLEETFADMDLGFTVSIRGPDEVDKIVDQDPAKRAEEAAQIARDIKADIVIYGLVNTMDRVWQVVPEFYVASEGFFEADEITGQYQIGAPISVKGKGGPATRIELNEAFLPRAQALVQIVTGLTFYSVYDYERAMSYFLAAEDVENWAENEGKQVLYLLIGNAAGKTGEVEMAEEYHKKALDLDPEYARAHVGLASAYYMQALEPARASGSPAQTDLELIDRAITTYELADEATNKPPLSDITIKVDFGLGQSYFAHAYAMYYRGTQESFDAAVDKFQAVIDAYGDGTNPRVRVQAAESHARLALIYRLCGHPELADDEYELAASLWYDDPSKQDEYKQRAQEARNSIGESE